jgi:isopenicillin N synthase-like dioxygenase
MIMSATVATNLPVLDLAPYLAGQKGAAEKAAAQLREINETIGFMTIIGHGVPAELTAATFAEAARFHAQPVEEKLAVKVNLEMQGYLPMRGSTTRTSTLSTDNKPNENEAFFIKRSGNDAGADDRWPAKLPGFREATLRYYDAMDELAQKLLPLYALALGLPADYFAQKCDKPLSSLRLTHYPPVAYGANQYGIAPHSDSTFITLLAQNKVPGLQVKTRDGAWIDAEVTPNSFVVNTGDVLHRWTNGRFLSTPHRAFNTSQSPRYAIPYFFHPNADTLIDCLPGCEVAGEAPRFPALTTKEYLAWFRGRNYDHIRKEKGEAPKQAAPAAAE